MYILVTTIIGASATRCHCYDSTKVGICSIICTCSHCCLLIDIIDWGLLLVVTGNLPSPTR